MMCILMVIYGEYDVLCVEWVRDECEMYYEH